VGKTRGRKLWCEEGWIGKGEGADNDENTCVGEGMIWRYDMAVEEQQGLRACNPDE